MLKPKPVQENETHSILWEMQTDYSVQNRKTVLVLITKIKRICHLVEFVFPVRKKKKESKNLNN